MELPSTSLAPYQLLLDIIATHNLLTLRTNDTIYRDLQVAIKGIEVELKATHNHANIIDHKQRSLVIQ